MEQNRLPLQPTLVSARVYNGSSFARWDVFVLPFSDHAGGRVCSETEARDAIHEWAASKGITIEDDDIRTQGPLPARLLRHED